MGLVLVGGQRILKYRFVVLAACALAGALACHPGQNRDLGNPLGRAYYPRAQQQADAAKAPGNLFARAQLKCDDPASCPSGVGMLTTRITDDEISLCTAFMVTDTVLATNDHCLPKNLNEGDGCTQIAEVSFAGTNEFAAEKRRCQTVLWRSHDGESEQKVKIDVAYLRVPRGLSRGALRFGASGPAENQVLRVYKVNPVADTATLGGTLKIDHCRALYGTVDLPYLDQPNSAAFLMAKSEVEGAVCNVMAGNSGSPLVDDAGEVRGVLRMTALTQKQLGIATNVACLPEYVGDHAPSKKFSPGCALAYDKNKAEQLSQQARAQVFSGVVEPQLDAAAENWGAQTLAQFRWKIQQIKVRDAIGVDESYYIPVPRCVAEPLRPEVNETVATPLELPTFTFALGADADLRPTAQVSTGQDKLGIQFQVAPIKTGVNWHNDLQPTTFTVKISTADATGADVTLFAGEVKPCSLR